MRKLRPSEGGSLSRGHTGFEPRRPDSGICPLSHNTKTKTQRQSAGDGNTHAHMTETERVLTVLVPSVNTIPFLGTRWPDCSGDKNRVLLLTKSYFNEILSWAQDILFLSG